MTALHRFLVWLGLRADVPAPATPPIDLSVGWTPCPGNDPAWLPHGTQVLAIACGRRCTSLHPNVAPVEFGALLWYYLPEEGTP